MSAAISIAFAVGLFATITPCGLPFAVAALGMRASAPDDDRRRPRRLRGKLEPPVVSGAMAGGVFAAIFLTVALIESVGVEISDLVPVVALVSAAVLAGLGIRAAVGVSAALPALRMRGSGPVAVFALAYALASLPCALGLLQGLFVETSKAHGAGGVIGVALLFAAGVVTAAIGISLLASLLSAGTRRLGVVGFAAAGVLTLAAGVIAAVYWLPAVVDGVGDRGGALARPLAEASGAVAEFVAVYELAFALLLLAAATAALVRALQGQPAQRS